MFHFAEAVSGPVSENTSEVSPQLALLPLAGILELMEKRLRWYGFYDWQIRDVLCGAGPSVTVTVRGPRRAMLTVTFARDGGVSHSVLTPAPALREAPTPVAARTAVVPHLARSLRARAIDALAFCKPGYGSSLGSGLLNRPAVCEG